MGKKEERNEMERKNGILNEKGYDRKKSAMGIMRMGIGGNIKMEGNGSGWREIRINCIAHPLGYQLAF